VVVVPYISLAIDTVERIRGRYSHILRAAQWTRDSSVDADYADVVVVSADVAASDGFATFLTALWQRGRIGLIAIDECHVVITDAAYRVSMCEHLRRLRVHPVPRAYLTATLPPSATDFFCAQLGMSRGTLQVVRAPTVRPNIAYDVRVVPADSPFDARIVVAAVDEVRRELMQLEMSGTQYRAIVYCATVDNVQRVADMLCVPMYYAGYAGKDAAFADWRERRARVICATSALGAGIDLPDIRLVVQVGRPSSALVLAQAFGRAGRDGHAAEALCVVGAGELARGWNRDAGTCAAVDKAAVDGFLAGDACRRRVLHEHSDGGSGPCHALGARLCDVCGRRREEVLRGQREEVQRGLREGDLRGQRKEEQQADAASRLRAQAVGTADVTAHVRAMATVEEEMREALEAIKQWGCATCWLAGARVEGRGHGLNGCASARLVLTQRGAAAAFGFRGGTRVPASLCWRCWCGEAFCRRARTAAQGERCGYGDIVFPVVAHAWYHLRRGVLTRGGGGFPHDGGVQAVAGAGGARRAGDASECGGGVSRGVSARGARAAVRAAERRSGG
jgi:superfamily II DNA or RNA helicase